jgi:ribulose-phosphate 3-epimerase
MNYNSIKTHCSISQHNKEYNENTIIAPSVLAADFGNLQRDIEMINASEADSSTLTFVPNISYGMPVLESIINMPQKQSTCI